MITTAKESSTPISRILKKVEIGVDKLVGWLNPVAVIEKRHMVADPSKPIQDTDFFNRL